MTQLEQQFERKARAALLDDVEHKLIGEEANLAFQFVELVHTLLDAYAQRHGYDVESTKQSVRIGEVDRSDAGIAVTVGWDSDQMARWEFGVSEHEIGGDPILSFIWADPPQWVRQEFDQGRDAEGRFVSGWRVFLSSVDHPGIPESRAIRDAINAYRRLVSA